MGHSERVGEVRGLSPSAFRTMFARAPDMCVTLQLGSGTIMQCNEAVRTTLGYAPNEVVGHSILTLADPDDPDGMHRSWHTLVRDADLPASNVRVRRKDGGKLDVCVTARGVQDDDGHIAFGLAVLRARVGARDRRKSSAQSPERLRALLYALSVAEERERRRIAAGLHDELGQLLAIAKLKLGMLGDADNAADRTRLVSELGGIIDQAARAARSTTFELSSPVLQQFGLEAAIQSLGERMERLYGISFRFAGDGPPGRLPEESPVVLLRVVRELLFNVHKHARARSVAVSVHRTERLCTLLVEDDGIGFVPGAVGAEFTPAGGFGLFSAQAQIESIGGSFIIESSPDRGTRALIRVPLPGPPRPG